MCQSRMLLLVTAEIKMPRDRDVLNKCIVLLEQYEYLWTTYGNTNVLKTSCLILMQLQHITVNVALFYIKKLTSI